MTAGERGFLLLTSRLGVPDRKVLTSPQLRKLALAADRSQWRGSGRELTGKDLAEIGIGGALADRILELLDQEDVLNHYLARGAKVRCVPLTRASREYPPILRSRLDWESPGCLWAKGDLSLLHTPTVSLVGSRELREENRSFADTVGRACAGQGITLVSGNARGADKTAQDACLAAGGKVISIVADDLGSKPEQANMLYLSEDGFDAPFSANRALSRNRCIHALGRMTFVAQAGLGKGGSWKGTVQNLQKLWSPVCVFDDGSDAAGELERLGAYLVREDDLRDLSVLCPREISFFEITGGRK